MARYQLRYNNNNNANICLFSHKTYYMLTINDLHNVCDRFNFIQSHRNEQCSTSDYIRQ